MGRLFPKLRSSASFGMAAVRHQSEPTIRRRPRPSQPCSSSPWDVSHSRSGLSLTRYSARPALSRPSDSRARESRLSRLLRQAPPQPRVCRALRRQYAGPRTIRRKTRASGVSIAPPPACSAQAATVLISAPAASYRRRHDASTRRCASSPSCRCRLCTCRLPLQAAKKSSHRSSLAPYSRSLGTSSNKLCTSFWLCPPSPLSSKQRSSFASCRHEQRWRKAATQRLSVFAWKASPVVCAPSNLRRKQASCT